MRPRRVVISLFSCVTHNLSNYLESSENSGALSSHDENICSDCSNYLSADVQTTRMNSETNRANQKQQAETFPLANFLLPNYCSGRGNYQTYNLV
jgi:hypothetical protein